MVQHVFGSLQLWQFEKLAEVGVRHFVSGRRSAGSDAEFNVSFSTAPDPVRVSQHRKLLAEAMKIDPAHLYFPRQTHEDRIVRVTMRTQPHELENTDALITNQPGCCVAVMSADCVPILLYDTQNQAAAAVHSGWRGTVAHILTKTLNQMQAVFGTQGVDVIATIGPSVCQQSYEVGDEVIRAVQTSFSNHSELLETQSNGKAKLDLWMANYVQLKGFGVPEENIEIANLCTVMNNSHFFSARRGDTGRFAAGIVLS